MISAAKQAGAVVQGVALGLMLAYSILSLTLIASGVRLFRYQGF